MFYPFIKEAGFVWMMPIVFLSFCAMAFCLERTWYWLMYFFDNRGREEKLNQVFLSPFNSKTVRDYCKNSSDIVIITLGEFVKNYDDFPLVISERKTRMFAEKIVEESRSFLDLLSLIANISGTLGLMGTVVGISLSFKTMASENSKAMAESLSTALYTTIGGIILFLMAYLFLFFLQKLSDGLENALDDNIHKLNDLIEAKEKSSIIFEDVKGEKEKESEQKISITVEKKNKDEKKE